MTAIDKVQVGGVLTSYNARWLSMTARDERVVWVVPVATSDRNGRPVGRVRVLRAILDMRFDLGEESA